MAKEKYKESNGISGKPVRRSLHFFWLIDWSGSMAGERIQKVNYAIRTVLPEIRRIEESDRINIFMRAIKFGTNAMWHIGPDPVPVNQFSWVDMDASGGSTSTSQAINLLTSELDINKIGKRNVPPVVILLSDGMTTDEPESIYYDSIKNLDKSPWGKKAVRLSIGIGDQTEDYDKEQLDAFISPYLKNQGVETFAASDSRKLIHYIRMASTVATQASIHNDGKNDSNDAPVIIDTNKFNFDDDGPDFSKLGSSDVF